MQSKPQKPVSTAEIVKENYYWVKCYQEDAFEPAKCRDVYGNGNLYFHFTNGSIMEVNRVWEYQELKYVEPKVEPLKVQITMSQIETFFKAANSTISEAERQNKEISRTVEIIVTDKCEYHLGGDSIQVYIKRLNIATGDSYRIY